MKILKRLICFSLVILIATFCLVQCCYDKYFKREEIELYEELNRRWDLDFSSDLVQTHEWGKIGFDARGNVYRILEVNQNDSILDNFVNDKNDRFETCFLNELYWVEQIEQITIDKEYIPSFDKEYRYFAKKKFGTNIVNNDLLNSDDESWTSYLYVFHYIEDPNILYFVENV